MILASTMKYTGAKCQKHVARVSLDDIHIWNLCLERGNALGVYASQALKVSVAAQPKGCSAHFVPMMAINKPDFLADIENVREMHSPIIQALTRCACRQ